MSAISMTSSSAEPSKAANERMVGGGENRSLGSQILKNAKITLEVSCLAKRGESVLILVDKDPQRVACAQALEASALGLGVTPIIMDLSAYSRICQGKPYSADPEVLKSRIFKPAKAAAESADIIICIRSPGLTLTYANLFGVPYLDDVCLTAKDRRMEFQYTNMDKWSITPECVAAIRPRTTWLTARLQSTKVVRITSPAGTDLSVPMGKGTRWYPILGIVPLYGEVAIVPSLEPETKGVIVIDGSTYRGVRPPMETDRQPLRIVMKDGRVQEITGDPEQVARLKKLDANNSPAGLGLDEVGLVTTTIADNDAYWTNGRFDNGTHSHDTIHIALGKNFSRSGVVHGKLHMDMDVRRPTVSLDGLVVIKDGVFVDSVLEK